MGFATETARACIDFGFDKLSLNKIVGRAIKENIASIRILEKIGMAYRKELNLSGQNWVIYEITSGMNK